MLSCVLPRPILPREPTLSHLSWLLEVCPHKSDFLLENRTFPNDARNNCLQERPRLLSKEIGPYSLQPHQTDCEMTVGSRACAYKWCSCVMLSYRYGEDVGRGRERIFFFGPVMCLTPTWHWRCWQKSEISPPLTLWQRGWLLLSVLLFTKDGFFSSRLFLELEMFQKPMGSIKLWCLVMVLYFSAFKNL